MGIRAKNIDRRAVSNARLGTDAPKHQYTFEDFRQDPIAVKRLGAGAATGTAGDRNLLGFGHNQFEYHIKGTQTIVAPVLTAVGLDIGMDQTDNDGIEITQGILARHEHAFTIGTHGPFFFRVKVKVEDASGCDPLHIGFRKAEAYQAAYTGYADYAYLGLVGGDNPSKIQTETEVGGGGTVTTDTTLTCADGATKDLKVRVDGKGQVTYFVNGVKVPISVAYTFTAALVVVPSLFFLHGADVAGVVELIEWECGLEKE